MPRIFAYIQHTSGVASDCAAELLAAARRIDANAAPAAILSGYGADLDNACDSVRSLYSEIWKIGNEALSYPNAELVRQGLVAILPRNSILLVAHDHFGIDLSPGLSIKLNCAFVPDVLAIDPIQGESLNLVRDAGQRVGLRRKGHSGKGQYCFCRGAC